MNLEKALLCYSDYKAGRPVDWKYKAYLELLAEGDVIGSFLIGTTGDRKQYSVLKLFVSGMSLEALIARNGIPSGQLREWIEGFIDTVLDRFLITHGHYCPFCRDTQKSKSLGIPRPLNGHVCYCRELRELAEEEEYRRERGDE